MILSRYFALGTLNVSDALSVLGHLHRLLLAAAISRETLSAQLEAEERSEALQSYDANAHG